MPLTNEQYQVVKGAIDERRSRAELSALERKREVSQKVPALKELLAEISKRGADSVKRCMAGDLKAREEFSVFLRSAAERKAALLSENGFPKDYLETRYTCEKCADTGYLPNGEKCSCFRQLEYDLVFSQDRQRRLFSMHNFNTFDLSVFSDEGVDEKTGFTPRENAKRACETAKKFLSSSLEGKKNLLIYGTTGTGKTFLSHCIAKEALDKGLTVIYLTAPEFMDIASDYEFKHKDGPFRKVMESSLLIIDDLGTELINSFVISAVYRVVNERLLSERRTVISTNLFPSDLAESYNERVLSRIAGNYQFIRMTGPDLRLQ